MSNPIPRPGCFISAQCSAEHFHLKLRFRSSLGQEDISIAPLFLKHSSRHFASSRIYRLLKSTWIHPHSNLRSFRRTLRTTSQQRKRARRRGECKPQTSSPETIVHTTHRISHQHLPRAWRCSDPSSRLPSPKCRHQGSHRGAPLRTC